MTAFNNIIKFPDHASEAGLIMDNIDLSCREGMKRLVALTDYYSKELKLAFSISAIIHVIQFLSSVLRQTDENVVPNNSTQFTSKFINLEW